MFWLDAEDTELKDVDLILAEELKYSEFSFRNRVARLTLGPGPGVAAELEGRAGSYLRLGVMVPASRWSRVVGSLSAESPLKRVVVGFLPLAPSVEADLEIRSKWSNF